MLSYELFINFRVSFHLRVKSAGILTIKIFRKIMFDFKRIIHQTKPICDRRNVTWLEFCCQKHMIYPGPGGSAKYREAEETFSAIYASQCNEVQIISVPT